MYTISQLPDILPKIEDLLIKGKIDLSKFLPAVIAEAESSVNPQEIFQYLMQKRNTDGSTFGMIIAQLGEGSFTQMYLQFLSTLKERWVSAADILAHLSQRNNSGQTLGSIIANNTFYRATTRRYFLLVDDCFRGLPVHPQQLNALANQNLGIYQLNFVAVDNEIRIYVNGKPFSKRIDFTTMGSAAFDKKAWLEVEAEGNLQEYVENFIEQRGDTDTKAAWAVQKVMLMHFLCEHAERALVKKLVQVDANLLSAPSRMESETTTCQPLHRLASTTQFGLSLNKARLKMVQVLLKLGADVEAQNEKGLGPLHLAAQQQTFEMLKVLLESGADATAQNSWWTTPLDSWISSYQYNDTHQKSNPSLQREIDPRCFVILVAYGATIPTLWRPNEGDPAETDLKSYFMLKSLIEQVQALKPRPANTVELARAFINAYINPPLFSFHEHIEQAQSLLKRISSTQNFTYVESEVNLTLQRRYFMSDSIKFKALCHFILSSEFALFLRPTLMAPKPRARQSGLARERGLFSREDDEAMLLLDRKNPTNISLQEMRSPKEKTQAEIRKEFLAGSDAEESDTGSEIDAGEIYRTMFGR